MRLRTRPPLLTYLLTYLCLGGIEIQKVPRCPYVLVPQIRSNGDFEGERIMSTGGPSIGLLRTSTSGHAVIQQFAYRLATTVCQQSKISEQR